MKAQKAKLQGKLNVALGRNISDKGSDHESVSSIEEICGKA